MDSHVVQDYRAILRDELAARCQRNARYSQRAFARDLRVAPHRLSQVLGGKLGLSRRSAEAIAVRLGYNQAEQQLFCDLVDKEHARSAIGKRLAAERLARRKKETSSAQLDHERFKLIADWYHLAIIELARIPGFRAEPRWIARRLGLAEIEASQALARLEKLGFAKRQGKKLIINPKSNAVPSGVPSTAVRTFHQRLIERSLGALATQSLDEREFNTSLVAIPRRRLDDVRQRVRLFWTSIFSEFATEQDEPDALYCLGVQFFRLSEHDTHSLEDVVR